MGQSLPGEVKGEYQGEIKLIFFYKKLSKKIIKKKNVNFECKRIEKLIRKMNMSIAWDNIEIEMCKDE